jgi:lipopolysaccharide/colanic/teichoic acid biosynthesis glycosyltransferase
MGRGGLEPHEQMVKRIMDIAVSAIAILVFSPVMLLAAIAILAEDGRPAFFLQKRKTIGGNVFEIVKFRTMRKDTGENGPQVSVHQGDGRITRVGAFLRKFRLDELPQFFNILKGDMSMVGPRPEMLENVAQYSKEFPAFVYRQKMKAGLTGYAQIEGRYNTTAKDKLMMDLMYIENYSIWMDVKLLFRTLTVFFKADSTQGFEMHVMENDDPAEVSSDIGRVEDTESREFASPSGISSTYHSAG